jgi:hypothetical protein
VKRRSVDERRLLRYSLGFGLVVGLAAHSGGYLLKEALDAYQAAQRDQAQR